VSVSLATFLDFTLLIDHTGMGNRFKDMPQYQSLIRGHGVIAVITFLFICPAAIFIARFYGRNPGRALHLHIYLQVLTLGLSTVVFVLGMFAVGPKRSLTNPHHGIGLAIYVIILAQAIGGGWIYKREKGKARKKLPVKLVLHQWLGRAVAILGMIQIPLGLTLWGSPKWTFILYTLWMFFLLVLWFVLSYRAMGPIGGLGAASSYGGTSTHGGTVIGEKKERRGWFAPLAAGAGIAALIARRKSKNRSRSRSRSRSQSRSRVEVIPSRRGSRRDSESFIEEEKFESRKESGGIFGKVMKGAGILGAGALAKSWYDRRQDKKSYVDDYSSVAQDTPSKHRRRHSISEDSSEFHQVHTMEEGRRKGAILPGPGDPVNAAAAISAAEPRPVATRPGRRHSYDSDSSFDSTLSPSRRPRSSHGVRNGLLAGAGLGWAANKWRNRRKSKEQDRIDRYEEDRRIEDERLARQGKKPSKFTGDGHTPTRHHSRKQSYVEPSDLSYMTEDRHHIQSSTIPPIPSALGGAAAMSGGRSSSQVHQETFSAAPPQPHFFPQPESGSEQYFSAGGAPHRRHSSRRRREGEAAAAIATAAGMKAQEEARMRSRSRDGSYVASPPISVKVKMHGDNDRNVTLRRLTEAEAAAERSARRASRQRRAGSVSSVSGTDTTSNNRRYRRDRRNAESEVEKRAEAGMSAPPMTPLSPPNPAFAKGRRPAKDSAYYSGDQPRPGTSGMGAGSGLGPGSVGSPESHGTWSGMSGSENHAERSRRRRLERNQRPSGTVDFN